MRRADDGIDAALLEHCTLDAVLSFVAARDEVRRMVEILEEAVLTEAISQVAPTIRTGARYEAEPDPFPCNKAAA